MATTAQNICDRAYRKIGIISPTMVESAVAFESLNDMISLWGTMFLVPYLVRESFDLVVGTRNYTIGGGGDFDTIRPVKITNITLRDSDKYNYSTVFISGKEWDAIRYKESSGRPTKVYYKPEYPLGIIRFNKKPSAADKVYMCSWKNFTEFATITTEVSLPNEYKDAMIYNLTVRLSEDNSIELPRSVGRHAALSLVLLGRLLASNRRVPNALFEFADGSTYDIENDI